FTAGIAGLVATWPPVVRAQRIAMPTIGLLGHAKSDVSPVLQAFREALSQTGYIENKHVIVEYRLPGPQSAYELANELVRLPVNVIATAPAVEFAQAAKAATSSLPIIFNIGADPVKHGLVASLNRPGGNVTGVTQLNVEVGQKRLELL